VNCDGSISLGAPVPADLGFFFVFEIELIVCSESCVLLGSDSAPNACAHFFPDLFPFSHTIRQLAHIIGRARSSASQSELVEEKVCPLARLFL
jgi:hypothetical protein